MSRATGGVVQSGEMSGSSSNGLMKHQGSTLHSWNCLQCFWHVQCGDVSGKVTRCFVGVITEQLCVLWTLDASEFCFR